MRDLDLKAEGWSGSVSLSSFLLAISLVACLLSTLPNTVHASDLGSFLSLEPDSGIYSGAVPPPYYEVVATVTSMIDGDTTWVRIEKIVVELDPEGEVFEGNLEKVRYGGGIDAPETWTDPPESGSYEATEFVENLIPVGTTVYLDLNDLSKGGQTGRPYRGTYERLIGVIYTVIDGRWVNVNAELLKWGLEEYPDHAWLRYIHFPSEWDPYEWLDEDYPYALDFVERRDVMVSILPRENIGAPGEEVGFKVFVKNTGNVEDTYILTATDEAGWNLRFADNLLECVGSGHVGEAALSVAIPEEVEERVEDTVTVTVTSREDAGVSNIDSCTVRVRELPPAIGVQVLVSPPENSAPPGASIVFAVTVTNTGNVIDNYVLTVADDAGWGAMLEDNLLKNVAPGEERQVFVNAPVPDGAVEGESTVITITAISLSRSTATSSAECTAEAGATEEAGGSPEIPWAPVASIVIIVAVVVSLILIVRPI